jgi:hypothetical protein
MHRGPLKTVGARHAGDPRIRPHGGLLQLARTVLLIAFVFLAGCSTTKGWLDKVTPGGGRDADETVILGAPTAEDYLKDLQQLAIGDPATQIEIFADAESRATLTPDPSTTLRYALVLGTPGHTEYDPEMAQSNLRELLTQTELMTSAEIALGDIYLDMVEQSIVLRSEARRLRQSTSRQAQTEEQATNLRIATVEAENRRLRSALEEAEDKLAAISTIERDIRDQEQ